MGEGELEVEVKFRTGDTEGIVEKLKKIGAERVDSGLEENIVFDKNGEITNKGELLRLRMYAGKADITHKGRKMKSERFKVRKEVIVKIHDFNNGKMLLESLGFRSLRLYEKKRDVWKYGDLYVMVDLMPFMGNFIEIEGSEKGITEMAGKLGLDMKDGIKKDYAELFVEYMKEKGISERNLLFSEEKK